ncbi:tol2 transposase [Lasius niger]|uniref:Tol2 transposase n=1 Tax=Lasius niger TaxID=67767 RepID=A0A0J7K6B4_LASNI|nr:tol2 transposase [Lasius niger]
MTNVKQSLEAVDFVCTTADVWSSSKRSFLGITVHWIDSGTLKREGAAIACRRFKGAHTYDKVAKVISEVHSEFDLKLCKITKTIIDNGSNMVKAFKMFGRSESIDISSSNCQQSNDYNTVSYDEDNEDDEIDGDNDLLPQTFPEPVKDYVSDYELLSHERCPTHTLHLIAAVDTKQAMAESNAYKKVHNSAFGKCQALWNLCARSPKACETYLDATGKSSTSPCPTRWNSYYDSVNDLLIVKEHLNEALKILKFPLFKETDLQFVSEYIKCLKPIAEAIQSLQGEKNTYYGMLLPELMRIVKILSSLKMENLKYCANDAILASVTHPFFKMKWVPKEKKEHVKALFLMETRKLKQNENDQKESSTEKKKRDESYFMLQDDSSDSSSTSETTGDLEALQYLQDRDT